MRENDEYQELSSTNFQKFLRFYSRERKTLNIENKLKLHYRN